MDGFSNEIVVDAFTVGLVSKIWSASSSVRCTRS